MTTTDSSAKGGPVDSQSRLDPAPTPPPFRSVQTDSFAQILEQFSVSLAVTTYQANKLVLMRTQRIDGKPVVNTHLRELPGPMGFAWEPGRFAIGTTNEIWEFHDVPDVARKLGKTESGLIHDAAYLPRNCHVTGDIMIHEMAWLPRRRTSDYSQADAVSELWFINTRFSCLCTRSDQGSFVPRWKPPFISTISPDDRCHLNSMCVRDGEIHYVTSLGSIDAQAGWRQNKKSGGVLTDVRRDQVITRGLSMPHSPRWYDRRLWLLESGNGGLGIVDEQTGRYQEVCRLPGFTRGLDFVGPYAFIGISQVRESATFSGIAVTEIPEAQRVCGVWVVDLRTGTIAGSLQFLDSVQEIFAVQTLPGLRWPEVLGEDQEGLSTQRRFHTSPTGS